MLLRHIEPNYDLFCGLWILKVKLVGHFIWAFTGRDIILYTFMMNDPFFHQRSEVFTLFAHLVEDEKEED